MMFNTLNDNEKQFVDMIDAVWRYVKGELELDHIDGEWYAMDYRKDMECAFTIAVHPYDEPLITDKEAQDREIDIIKCCDACDIMYVE